MALIPTDPPPESPTETENTPGPSSLPSSGDTPPDSSATQSETEPPEPSPEPTPTPPLPEPSSSTCGTVETPCFVATSADQVPEFFALSLALVVFLLAAIFAAQLRRP